MFDLPGVKVVTVKVWPGAKVKALVAALKVPPWSVTGPEAMLITPVWPAPACA